MKVRSKAYLQMHIATFLWGLTAILGKMISVREFPLVWFRMLMVAIFMLFTPSLYTSLKNMPKKNLGAMCFVGVLLAIHWLAWYASIKYSNASVAVSCIALISFFVSIIEPIFLRTRFDKINIVLGVLVIPGILLINQSLDLSYKFGFSLGILAAFLSAVFTILNKQYAQDFSPASITFIQMLSGWIFLCVCLPFYIHFNPGNFFLPDTRDLILLVILSFFCTVIPYTLFLSVLKVSNAFTTTLINNLEPVYGIILAAVILHENTELNWKFYVGTAIILSAVFIHAIQSNKSEASPT